MRENNKASVLKEYLLTAEVPIAVLSHPSPDGDSIGSTLGICGILTAAGRAVQPVLPPLPTVYSFLHGCSTAVAPPYDLAGKIALVLDCSDLSRLGQAGQTLTGAMKIVNIDHHQHNEYFGDLNYVDTRAAAVGEIIHRLFRDETHLYSPQVAEALFTAIVTDTGRFSYSNTTANTFEAAASLVRRGAEPAKIYNHLYQCRASEYLAFLTEALARIELHFDGKVALLPLSKTLLDSYSLADWELDEISDYPRSLANTLVAVVLKETGEKHTKVSFRSKGVDVASLARAFGGGGHHNAAGATLFAPLTEAKALVLKLFEGEDSLWR